MTDFTPTEVAARIWKLKPCPFCGGAATDTDDGARRGNFRQSTIIVCTSCGASVESGDVYGLTQSEQLAWNDRATLPSPDLRAAPSAEEIARVIAGYLPVPHGYTSEMRDSWAEAKRAAEEILALFSKATVVEK